MEIDGLGLSPAPGATSESAPASIELKNDFMTLLVEGMRGQDPFSDQDQGQFLAQLAQFTGLEQTENLTASINALIALQSQSAAVQDLSAGSALIGKQVTFTAEDGSDQKGIVESVVLGADGAYLKVGEYGVPLGAVQEVSDPPKDDASGEEGEESEESDS